MMIIGRWEKQYEKVETFSRISGKTRQNPTLEFAIELWFKGYLKHPSVASRFTAKSIINKGDVPPVLVDKSVFANNNSFLSNAT